MSLTSHTHPLVPFKAVVPARYASTRLPGKPLMDICGQPMVVRVAQAAKRSGAQEVIVATDHEDIAQVCKNHQIDVLMTRPDCPSGTDRIAEVAHARSWADSDIVVNVQGDEPLIDPAIISDMAALLSGSSASIATCGHPIHNWEDFCNPNIVKIALTQDHMALYFSRAPIPYPRDLMQQSARGPLPAGFQPIRHIGLYAYTTSFLKAYSQWGPSDLDQLESLEQLRALHHGHRIVVKMIDHPPSPGVDTAEDLEKVRRLWKSHHTL